MHFLKKKLYDFLKFYLIFLIKILCYFKLSFLNSFLTGFFIKNIKYNKKKITNILIIRKSAGFDDVMTSLNKKKNNYNIYVIPRFVLKNIFINFLSKSSFNDNEYYKKNKNYLNKKKVYQEYVNKFLGHIVKKYKINLIINFNVMYKEVDAFAFSSNINKVNFLTLQKEYIFSKGRFEILKKIYQKRLQKYQDTYIATYNKKHKECFLLSKWVKKKNIFIVGCPRLDLSFAISRGKKFISKKKPITLIYYKIHKRAGLPYFDDKFNTYNQFFIKKFDWAYLKKITEKILFEHACNKKNLKLIIKTKPPENFKLLDKNQFKNIKVINGGVGHTLLENADAVVAFNSTTVLESIASKTPVIIPNFDKNKHGKFFKMDLVKTNLIKIANSPGEFLKYLDQIQAYNKRQKKLSIQEKKILEMYMGNSDCGSSLRLFNLIKKLTS